MAIDRHQIETFLYREARLMDEHAYDEWLALWTDDALYWVPCNRDDSDPMRQSKRRRCRAHCARRRWKRGSHRPT